ncbi:Sporulation protein RMD1 [Chlorella vulgaris]
MAGAAVVHTQTTSGEEVASSGDATKPCGPPFAASPPRRVGVARLISSRMERRGSEGTQRPPLQLGRSSSTPPARPSTDDDAGLLRKLLKRSAQLRKNRDKLVALLEEGQLAQLEDPALERLPGRNSMDGGDDEAFAGESDPPITVGRITIHCTATSYDLKGLRLHLEESGHTCSDFPEVLYSRYVKRNGEVAGDIAFFDFGVCVFWNLTPLQEHNILETSLKGYEEGKLSSAKVESDTFQFRLIPYAKPSIQNDLITLSPTMIDPHLIKLSISFALAQSTKLSVLEERALSIAEITRKLPKALASEGKVRISDKAVAKLMGQVFIEQAALNLLGSVLDTPDFFWESGMKDSMQSVYDKVFDYLEMEDRIAVLNARLAILHELLDMLRIQGQAQHSDFLEWIVIALICIDCVILLAQVAATLGVFGFQGEHEGLRGIGAVAATISNSWVGLG